MFDFMNEEENAKNPQKSDSLSIANDSLALQELALRLEKAADKIIAERDAYKQEINQCHDRIEELEEQINNDEIVKQLEAELLKAQKLQMNLEKRITSLIEKLKDLLEEENI